MKTDEKMIQNAQPDMKKNVKMTITHIISHIPKLQQLHKLCADVI